MNNLKQKLTFILVSRWIFPYANGGIAMHNRYLLEGLKDFFNLSGITIFESNSGIKNFKYETKIIFVKGFFPSIFSNYLFSNFLKNGLRSLHDWIISRNISKQLESNLPDIVEFMDIHSEAYIFLKRFPKNKRKTKVVIRSHTPWGLLKAGFSSSEIKGVDGWYAFEREKYCFLACDAITTPSEDLKLQLVRIYKIPFEKIYVLPNILDTNHFQCFNRINSDDFTFLHVGRFERAKGVITMIKAFIEISKVSTKTIKLLNIGQPRGDAYEICLSLLHNAGLINNVTFEGFIDYEDLPKFYERANAVIVPAEIYESFSYTVAQAMSCGKIILATHSGGIPETTNFGEFAMLFSPGSVEELKELMFRALTVGEDDYTLAHEYAVHHFGIGTLTKKYVEFYTKICTT